MWRVWAVETKAVDGFHDGAWIEETHWSSPNSIFSPRYGNLVLVQQVKMIVLNSSLLIIILIIRINNTKSSMIIFFSKKKKKLVEKKKILKIKK